MKKYSTVSCINKHWERFSFTPKFSNRCKLWSNNFNHLSWSRSVIIKPSNTKVTFSNRWRIFHSLLKIAGLLATLYDMNLDFVTKFVLMATYFCDSWPSCTCGWVLVINFVTLVPPLSLVIRYSEIWYLDIPEVRYRWHVRLPEIICVKQKP